ncbi:hypothetical protein GCM10010301_10570 [Streptomyces plicatus]|nr:hypothetical protein GCM10010301_10570 [Streptomyces plicatus]
MPQVAAARAAPARAFFGAATERRRETAVNGGPFVGGGGRRRTSARGGLARVGAAAREGVGAWRPVQRNRRAGRPQSSLLLSVVVGQRGGAPRRAAWRARGTAVGYEAAS